MKKIFEIPELEVVRFVEADIVVCSDCHDEWGCSSYSDDSGIRCSRQRESEDDYGYDSDNPLDGNCYDYGCIIDHSEDPYTSHYTG